VPAALLAGDTHVSAQTPHLPQVISARVRLLHSHDIADPQLKGHDLPSPARIWLIESRNRTASLRAAWAKSDPEEA
jgi:hypothetical protein